MRATLLTTAVAAALAMTAGMPGRAEAQIIISPTISSSPYVYSSHYPVYNYTYAWSNPFYNTYQSYWGSPYANYNWTWVTPNYAGYRSVWPYGYGWRGYYWR